MNSESVAKEIDICGMGRRRRGDARSAGGDSKAKGMTVFARINFSKDAAAVGLALRPTQLLILGSPASGTPLMAAAPSVALDLPLKVLAWQDDSNRCWVSFNAPEYLQQRHGFPEGLMANIAGLQKLVQSVVTASDRVP